MPYATAIKKIIKRIGNPFGLTLGSFVQYEPRQIPAADFEYEPVPPGNAPSISIVTPCYNHGQFLDKTITSILDQNYPKLEYVIKDGGSTDNSVAVIKRHEKNLTYWESSPDAGQANAINLGFAHTTGEIMAWLNSDDCLTPGALHRIARYFENHPEVDVVYGNRIIVNEDGLEVGRWFLPPHGTGTYCWRDYVPQETMFWRRSLWNRAGGGLNEDFQFAMDWDLVLRFVKHNAEFVRLPCFLGMFTTHPAQKSLAIRESHGEKEFARLRSEFAPNQCLALKYKALGAMYLLRSTWWCRKGRRELRSG